MEFLRFNRKSIIWLVEILYLILQSNYCFSGRKSHKFMNESDAKMRKDENNKSAANRSFNETKPSRSNSFKRGRSQSYTEGKSCKSHIDSKRFALSNGRCSSDDQSVKNVDDSLQEKDTIIDDVVKEGRYFLGENMGRMTCEIDGSRNRMYMFDDDQLEWDDESELTAT